MQIMDHKYGGRVDSGDDDDNDDDMIIMMTMMCLESFYIFTLTTYHLCR